ncbi:hypothetical protein [Gimesia aquarii]|uniref:hypothetical protein n=1 Tax=Gimesia aquarii TaxID=2527964 RepID=UPI0011A79C6D|nr:hypothetical protein [Gimesia aquarii]
MTTLMKASVVFSMLLTLSAYLVGCSASSVDDAPERAITSGIVSFSGNPITQGQISFIPKQGPTAMGPIKDGNYRIDSKGGVPVGKCQVKILAYEETGKEYTVGAGGKKAKETKQIIPNKYNKRSTLHAEINAGKENKHDFDLK